MQNPATMFVSLSEQVLDIDWSTEGDELLHQMWLILHERVPMTGYSYRQHPATESEPYFYFGFRATSDVLTSELALVPQRDGRIRAFVGVTSPDQVPSQVQPWADAILEASGRLSAGHPEHHWFAMIAPTGDRARGAQVLTTGGSVGGMTAHPATSVYLDAKDPRSFPTLSGFTYDVSFPVVVEGSSPGYDWSTASEIAAADLTTLCALLSLAFGACWRLRDAPDNRAEPVSPPRSRFRSDVFPESDDNWYREDVTFPEWADKAWETMRSQPPLVTALHAYHQGLDMMEAFPSYALLAFVGAIEGVGAMSEELRRCDCCSDCSIDIGSARRFRKALRLVLSRKEADELADVYIYRSKTAHEGRLHGDELSRGARGGARVFTPSPASDAFRYQTVWKMRTTAQQLLLHCLT